jgi:hypothetical protein
LGSVGRSAWARRPRRAARVSPRAHARAREPGGRRTGLTNATTRRRGQVEQLSLPIGSVTWRCTTTLLRAERGDAAAASASRTGSGTAQLSLLRWRAAKSGPGWESCPSCSSSSLPDHEHGVFWSVGVVLLTIALAAGSAVELRQESPDQGPSTWAVQASKPPAIGTFSPRRPAPGSAPRRTCRTTHALATRSRR